jgi:glycosyltransferase involved in cell wall biosynthesis
VPIQRSSMAAVSQPGEVGEKAPIPMNVSIILPVIDETVSLRKTVDIVLAENGGDICEILIVACKKTSSASLAVAEDIMRQHSELVHLRFQERPFLGGAMRDAFEWARGSHVLMMASDLETDPETVKELIARARQGFDIVTATRWQGAGGFQGYSRFKYLMNWLFQRIFRTLYGTPLSDLTFGFRIFKAHWVKEIAWEELRHPFLLETVLKPLRLGAKVVEIPSTWRVRVEGESHNSFWQNFVYLRIALKTRLRRREELLVRGPVPGTAREKVQGK